MKTEMTNGPQVITLLGLTLLAHICQAQEAAQKFTPQPQEVTVTGSQTDIEAGRDFVAGRIIIGRKRIADSGLQNVGELLKQVPAVSVGKDGRLGLLGLPGYTQILVDGASASSLGKSPTELELIQVEKIEIIKTTLAEHGPFGIAGTINIITRKTERKKTEQLVLSAEKSTAQPGGNVAWTYNQSETGSPLSFNTRVSLSQKTTPDENQQRLTSSSPAAGDSLLRKGQSQNEKQFSMSDIGGTINWQFSEQNKLSYSPAISSIKSTVKAQEEKRWSDGRTLDAQQRNAATMDSLWSTLTWAHTPDKMQRLEMVWTSNHMRLFSETQRNERLSGINNVLRNNVQSTVTDSDTLRLNYKAALPGGHDIKLGGQITLARVSADFNYAINSLPDTSLDALGNQRSARTETRRLFAQDDWRLTNSVALNFGVSTEDKITNITEGSYRGDSRFRLWSPSMHIAKKLEGDNERSLRLSLARSFQAPWIDQLTSRPQINVLAACPATGLCGANTIDTADSAGNPRLLPERSLGLNLSYEHGLGANSNMTVELYTRQIDRKLGTGIALENVPWSNVPRYVSRPSNLGDATVRGLDLEVQLALRDIWPQAPKLDFRSSLGLAHSEVSSLPGPDNRLDKQTPWRAKLGASYVFNDIPLKLNMDANWAPGGWVRTSKSERLFQDRTFGLSTNASWNINPGTRLFINLDNLLTRKSQRIDEYLNNNEVLRLQTDGDSHPRLVVRLEVKL